MAPLLAIKGLKTHFATDDGILQAVDGVDITIEKGETLGVVGESGCGKTVTAMSILKLIAMPPGRIVEGEIMFEGRDLVPLTSHQLDEVRAKEIGFIFQEPMTSLNPVLTVGEQVAESLRAHEGLSNRQALARAVEMLKLVQIPNAEGARARLSASVLGRHAPARHDRDGAGLQAQTRHRRRAHHRARRDHPGANPRPVAGHEGALRHGGDADHPCHGRGGRNRAARGGDVRRQDRRRGQRRQPVRRSAPPLYPRADPLHSAYRPRQRAQDPAGGDRRDRADPDQSRPRLPVRAALPPRHEHLHRKGAGVARDRTRPSHGLPSGS